MRIIRATTSAVRHGMGAAVEAGLVVAIAIALVFGAAVVGRGDPAGASDALAAKGGKPSITEGGSTITLNPTLAALSLGDAVTFTTTAAGLKGGEYPLVLVQCRAYPDGDVLYAQLDYPDATFVLGGGSSRWWLVRGDAWCRAWLYAYGGRSHGYDTIRELAGPVSFYAGG